MRNNVRSLPKVLLVPTWIQLTLSLDRLSRVQAQRSWIFVFRIYRRPLTPPEQAGTDSHAYQPRKVMIDAQ